MKIHPPTSSEAPNQRPLILFLFRSFVLIAGSYVTYLFVMGASALLISLLFFPDAYAIMNSEPETFNQVLATEPARVFPTPLLLTMIGLGGLFSFIVGYLLTHLAQVGRFTQTIFLAVILFVQYLQLMIGADESLRWSMFLCMLVSPIAALLGGNFRLRGLIKENAASTKSTADYTD